MRLKIAVSAVRLRPRAPFPLIFLIFAVLKLRYLTGILRYLVRPCPWTYLVSSDPRRYFFGIENAGCVVMLTEAAIRRTELRDKPFKLADMHGLYLLVNPNGTRY